MSYLIDRTAETYSLKPSIRIILILTSVGGLIAALAVAPMVLMLVGMSFDAPGSDWSLSYIPLIGLPILLLLVGILAIVALFTKRPTPAYIAMGFLGVDIAALGTMFAAAST